MPAQSTAAGDWDGDGQPIEGALFVISPSSGRRAHWPAWSGLPHQPTIDRAGDLTDLAPSSPSMVITAILVGKSLSNVVAAALSIDLARRTMRPEQYQNGGMLAAIALTTFILLTFSEIIPKALAKTAQSA